MYRMFLFISGQEIFIILLVVLLLFGANKIPEIARGLGKGMREFRKAADDIKREMNNQTNDFKKDLDEMNDSIEKTNDDLKG
ncbi:MAG: twin-arginine translocase TatA/TatE family subunit [Bacteroidales bacterium]|nr:twin-arginine translocase TatA/TatE family subunit [Bacteroidales bacterium]